MWRASILHCYKEGKNFCDLWWPWPLRYGHQKNLYNPGRVLDIFAKNEVYSIISLGGVWPQTHRQRTCGYYSINFIITYARLFMFWLWVSTFPKPLIELRSCLGRISSSYVRVQRKVDDTSPDVILYFSFFMTYWFTVFKTNKKEKNPHFEKYISNKT